MTVEDFEFGEDDNGIEYITFKENPTKTRQGGLHITRRVQLPKMFATGDERCPVSLFKEYISRRPSELRANGPFYLTPLPPTVILKSINNVWFKRQNLGVHSIDKIMKTIIADTPLQSSSKRLTNHSARKTLVKKLRENNVERSSIINVTGHRSEQSLNDYDEGNEVEQRNISNLISHAKVASKSLHTAPSTSMEETTLYPPNTRQLSFPTSSSNFSSMEQIFEQRLLPTNQFYNCSVVFNVGQVESRSRSVEKHRFKRNVIESDSDSQE